MGMYYVGLYRQIFKTSDDSECCTLEGNLGHISLGLDWHCANLILICSFQIQSNIEKMLNEIQREASSCKSCKSLRGTRLISSSRT